MKKAINLILSFALVLAVLVPISVPAEETAPPEARPVLTEVSFKNAVINEEFSPYINDYSLTLEDPSVTPTLKSYEIEGDANPFVTYALDEAKHQTGIIVTLEYESGTAIYNFAFSNAQAYAQNSNNLLSEVNCKLGEVYPAINDKITDYRLYVPSDMTTLQLSVATQDVSAYCDMPKEISLSAGQESNISITVTASNGDTRTYNFKIKRLNKTMEEVKAEMASPDFETLVKGELFYQKPAFLITAGSVAGGIILLALFLALAKRLTVKAEDADEEDFFESPETEEE